MKLNNEENWKGDDIEDEFHNSFLKILLNEDELEGQALFNYSATVDGILNSAPKFLQGVKRKQFLIKTNKDYYIARDSKTNTVYICFKNLLMIDIDKLPKEINDKSIEEQNSYIIEYFSKLPYSFRIYKSKRGYHVFCTSYKFNYRSRESVDFMLSNMSDPYYCMYSYIRGYCVRLNRKFEEINHKHDCLHIINQDKEDIDLVKLLNVMDKNHKKYKNELNMS